MVPNCELENCLNMTKIPLLINPWRKPIHTILFLPCRMYLSSLNYRRKTWPRDRRMLQGMIVRRVTNTDESTLANLPERMTFKAENKFLYICRSMETTVISPEGISIPPLSIEKWHFNILMVHQVKWLDYVVYYTRPFIQLLGCKVETV